MNDFVKAVSYEKTLLKLDTIWKDLNDVIESDLTDNGKDGLIGQILEKSKDFLEDAIDEINAL